MMSAATETNASAPSAALSSKYPVIIENPAVPAFYESLESRIGYRLVLGGTRHFGYWQKDTWWVLPISGPLRRMEQKLFERLNLPVGSHVLDAGCGDGHVALFLASRGLKMTGIDIVDHHLEKAFENVKKSGSLQSQVSVRKMDYHHLETLESASFDGVYTMETLVHAAQPEQVVAGFFRILRPGGHIVSQEYEQNFGSEDEIGPVLAEALKQMTAFGAMPTWNISRRDYFAKLLEAAGFVDIEVQDLSDNVRPMLRYFWLLARIPNFFIQLFGLQKHFINTVGGAYAYNGRKHWRYLSVSARKPDDLSAST